MRTKHKPDGATDGSPAARKTRGVRKLLRPNRPNPYGVQWPEKVWDEKAGTMVRKTKTLFFPTEEARDTKYREQVDARRSRMVVSSASRSELEEFRAFKAVTEGVPWQTVVAGWRAWLSSTGQKVCTVTVEEAAATYMANAKKLKDSNKLSPDTYRQKKHKMKLFVEDFGHLTLDRVDHHDVREWIEGCDDVESDFTFDNYRKQIVTFFSACVELGYITVNPVKKLKSKSDGIGEVHIISPSQTAQLFHTALTYRDGSGDASFMPAIGRLALEAFVGLRFASSCRLEKSDLNTADKGILLPKRKLKTKRRHYIDGMPDQIWDWIAITPESCWTLTPRQYMELKSKLFKQANVPHPHNCLRHGFATYHVAALKNPGLTAYLLCHRDQDELFEHYKGIATEAEGKLYHTLTPETVATARAGFVPATLEGAQPPSPVSP